MKKLLPIIIILLSVIVTSVGVIFAILNNKEKTMNENVIIIKKNYAELSENSTDNVSIRKKIIEKLNKFGEEDYATTREEYLELIKQYDENISKIDKNIETMNSKCDVQYEDNTINILCRSYADLYEEVINIYITNLDNYNNKVVGYNHAHLTNYESHKMLHTDYIDMNKDGTYQGL